MNKEICVIEGCECPVKVKSRGLCEKHNARYRRHGDPLAGKTFEGEPKKWIDDALKYTGNDCLIWPFNRDKDGYGKTNVNGKRAITHRIICELAHGPAPFEGAVVRHLCGKGHEGCQTPSHLAWGSVKENHEDMIVHDTRQIGERNHSTRLTAEKVLELRKYMEENPTLYLDEISEKFGIHRSTVFRIKHRKVWKHI